MEKVKSEVEKALSETSGPHYAAFDADGTLWDKDITFGFLKFQVEEGLLPYKSFSDLWEKTRRDFQYKKKEDVLLWTAQLHEGLAVEQLEGTGRSSFLKGFLCMFFLARGSFCTGCRKKGWRFLLLALL